MFWFAWIFFQEERRAQLTKYASAFGKTSTSLASPVSFPSVSQHSGQNIAQPRMMMMQVQWGSEYRTPEYYYSVFRWFLQPLLKCDHLNPSSLDCFIHKLLSSYPKEAKQLLNGCWLIPPSKCRPKEAQICSHVREICVKGSHFLQGNHCLFGMVCTESVCQRYPY